MLDPCFVVQYSVSFLDLANYLAGEERTSCFTSIGFLISCVCYCSLTLSHGAVGLPVVCNCGISWFLFMSTGC